MRVSSSFRKLKPRSLSNTFSIMMDLRHMRMDYKNPELTLD